MENSGLLSLLVETGNVAELNRLLSAYVRRPQRRLGPVELIELANNTAGADYRYPNPEGALRVAVSTGLVRKTGRAISLTDVGELFLDAKDLQRLDLSASQSAILLGLLLDDSEVATVALRLFREFGRGSTADLQVISNPSEWEPPLQALALIFQQLGVLRHKSGVLIVDSALGSFLPRQMFLQTSIDEETLWRRLAAQRLRARDAEEYVRREEQRRLARAGRNDLSQLVIRVSASDVAAGYDIRSFNIDDSARYIEVKSSIGKTLQFEWSVSERAFAAQNRGSYWIYFVPLAGSLKARTLPVWMLTNPLTLIRQRRLWETPSSYLVSEVRKRSSSKRFKKSVESLAAWP